LTSNQGRSVASIITMTFKKGDFFLHNDHLFDKFIYPESLVQFLLFSKFLGRM
jgi:hypothetical protein